MKAKLLNISLLVLLIFIVTKSYAGMGSENYGMEDSVFSNGGGPMASESFGVDSTLGQPSPLMEEEQPTSTNYAHYPGFWFTSNTPLVVTHNCQSIEFSRNCFLTEFGDRYAMLPRGDVEFKGIHFNIPTTGPEVWQSHDPWGTGPNPRTLDMQLNAYGINKVYTLINTGGGQPGGPYAWLEFWGSQGAYFRKDLFGNVDMRDWNLDGWTNYINNTTTVNVFLVNPGIYNGETRLDMQQIDLPEEFLTQSLTEIRLTDIGGSNFQRAFIVGATVCNAEITLVKLASFTAAPKSGKVLIQWATESEIDNAGFNLYRAETENGEYKKINTALIPAKGSSTQGASYEFVDSNVKNRKTYFYKLEDIDTSGVSTLHGPVKATPRLIFRLRD